MDVLAVKAGEHDDVGATLASAFADDPLFTWMVAAKPPIESRLEPFFSAMVKQTVRASDHLVFRTDNGAGAAVWRPVDKWKVPPMELLRSLPAVVRTMRLRLPAMLSALSTIEKNHPIAPHYYLEMLGTRRDQQGKGVGTALIQPMLERCDREGLPAYLESSNPQNIPFYARHGFERREELTLGKGAPSVTTMWREPRG
ncbi:MAG: GNAT family N-acetyltransferase [Acidimicrobiales bacterium]